jgi:hypothetical protein
MRELTDAERQLAEMLGKAFSLFVQLPVVHDDDMSEFRSAIHQCQNIVLARPAVESLNATTTDHLPDTGK